MTIRVNFLYNKLTFKQCKREYMPKGDTLSLLKTSIFISVTNVVYSSEPTLAHLYSYVGPNGLTNTPSTFGETSNAKDF